MTVLLILFKKYKVIDSSYTFFELTTFHIHCISICKNGQTLMIPKYSMNNVYLILDCIQCIDSLL